ncbi:uncharacterized protein BDV17DRAFT_165281 [Aspergillus undulatus]|uniref:uncharacterized protein n=1 Tax=Aspergillus undulatus TaxID=1810928 RepID=UPI003CCCE85D
MTEMDRCEAIVGRQFPESPWSVSQPTTRRLNKGCFKLFVGPGPDIVSTVGPISSAQNMSTALLLDQDPRLALLTGQLLLTDTIIASSLLIVFLLLLYLGSLLCSWAGGIPGSATAFRALHRQFHGSPESALNAHSTIESQMRNGVDVLDYLE